MWGITWCPALFLYMKKFQILILSLLSFAYVSAVGLDDRYVVKTIDNGQLYFIMPFDIPALAPKTTSLSADITYLTTNDYVTMNVSVWSKDEWVADSIILLEGGNRLDISYQTFFVEMEGKQWLHRYSLRYPLDILIHMYSCSDPYVLCFYTNGRQIQYSFSARSWQKEQKWMNPILHMILRNMKLYK